MLYSMQKERTVTKLFYFVVAFGSAKALRSNPSQVAIRSNEPEDEWR
jgi:hypothetical protein